MKTRNQGRKFLIKANRRALGITRPGIFGPRAKDRGSVTFSLSDLPGLALDYFDLLFRFFGLFFV
jgi:hypothetical protein